MLKTVFYLIVLVCLFAVNAGLLRGFEFFHALPDLLFLFSLYLALETESMAYLPLAFLSGLILDISSNVFLGSFSIFFMLGGISLRAFNRNVAVIQKNWKYLPFLVLIAQLGLYIWLLAYNRLYAYLGGDIDLLSLSGLLRRFLPEAVYNLLAVYPVWKLSETAEKLAARFSFKKI